MGPTPKMDSGFESVQQQLVAAQEEIAQLKLALGESQRANAGDRTTEDSPMEQGQAAQELKALVYAIGHDLRQPLRSILTSAQLLERRHPELPQVKEFSSYIVEGAHEISALVDNLMRFYKAGSGLRRSNVPLKLVVDLAMFKVQPLLAETGGSLSTGDLPEVFIDESQFSSVFEQLFTNAIRYGGEEPPRITVTAEEDEGSIQILVSDNGCGIEPQYHEQIFEPLKRLHGKDIPGAGLGLAICRKIVRAHDGRIWVESDGRHGSTFHISLPV